MGFYRGPHIVTDGLSLSLDAGSGRSYPGSGTTWYDLSGNNGNFTFSTTPTINLNSNGGYWQTTGVVATGPASNSLGITNTSGYTIFWVGRTVTGSGNASFKIYGDVSSNRGIFQHPSWTNNTIYFDQGGCCNSDQRLTYSNSALTDGTWTICGLRSTVSTRSIFYNGIKAANTTVTAANVNLNSTAMKLNSNDSGYNWDGYLSNFMVYNRALSDDEMLQNYNAFKSRAGL
tara:strand:+ start:705 stop:1397 length:693 start_codon:yes stop_codon:yes gene_type:complete